jgi:hypothetical protein
MDRAVLISVGLLLSFSLPTLAYDAMEPAVYGCYEKMMEWANGPSGDSKEAPVHQDLHRPYRMVYGQDLDDMRNNYYFKEVLVASGSGLFSCPACQTKDGEDCIYDLARRVSKVRKGRPAQLNNPINVSFLLKLKSPPPRNSESLSFSETLKVNIHDFESDSGVGSQSGVAIELDVADPRLVKRPVISIVCRETADPRDLEKLLSYLSRQMMNFGGDMTGVTNRCAKLSDEELKRREDCHAEALSRDVDFRSKFSAMCTVPVRKLAETADLKQMPSLKFLLQDVNRIEDHFDKLPKKRPPVPDDDDGPTGPPPIVKPSVTE